MDLQSYWQITMVTALAWGGLALTYLLCRCRLQFIACLLAPVYLLVIWLPHRWLFRDYFGSMHRIWDPSVVEISAAAFTWGIVATLLFSAIYWIAHRRGRIGIQPWQRTREVFKAMFLGHSALALAINLLGTNRAFGVLTVLDLHTYSLLIHARPGMGSGTFVPGSALLFFPVVGGLLFAMYAAAADCISSAIQPTPPPT